MGGSNLEKDWQHLSNYSAWAWVERYARLNPTKVALYFQQSQITYDQLNQHARKVAHALERQGVRKGDRVAVLIPNQPEFIEILVGCNLLGAIFVPINTRLAEEEIAYILEDSNPVTFIWDSSLESKAKKAYHHVLNRKRSMFPIQIGGDSNDVAQLFEDWRDSHAPFSGHCDMWEHDVALMMYTSGTTGRPKGAMITHSNVMWNALNISADFGGGTDDVILHTAPLFHITPLSILLFGLYFGGTSVLQKNFQPVSALEAIQEHRVTFAFMVPAMWQAVTQVPHVDQYDLRSLRICPSGGAPCPQPVIEFFLNLGCTFFSAYGLTETSPCVLLLPSKYAQSKAGSVGMPVMHNEVRLVDDNDRDIALGEVGEIVVRGRNVTAGYWNQPSKTEEAMRGGWFHTGDLARQDEDGFYYIVDRKKDMIISGGENIYPTEVEQVLFRHPDIQDVAVIGVPDPKWGETVAAIVVPKADRQIKLENIRSFCDASLARYKMPTRIHMLDALPRNGVGKVSKVDLRKQFGNEPAL